MNVPSPYHPDNGYTEQVRRLFALAEMGDKEAAAYLNQPFKFKVGSPIESALAYALLEVAYEAWIPEVYNDQRDVFVEVEPNVVFRIETQAPIGPYTADILLTGDGLRIVVECDGHAYHERTKEQAEHDKRRDRFLQAQGYRVLRFTGSEIHRDAQGAAREVLSIAASLARG